MLICHYWWATPQSMARLATGGGLLAMRLLGLRIGAGHWDPGICAATQSMLGNWNPGRSGLYGRNSPAWRPKWPGNGNLHLCGRISPAGRAKWAPIADWPLDGA